jgi:hypothetical protein
MTSRRSLQTVLYGFKPSIHNFSPGSLKIDP